MLCGLCPSYLVGIQEAPRPVAMAKYETIAMVSTKAESLGHQHSCRCRTSPRSRPLPHKYSPVENSGLPLNSVGKDKDTEETDSEKGKDDPESRVPRVSSMQEPHFRSRLPYISPPSRGRGD